VSAYRLTVTHGDTLDAADFAALQTVRRTLLGLLDHGSIAALETFAGSEVTVWSFAAGTEDLAGITAGLSDVLEVIAPAHWRITHDPAPPARAPCSTCAGTGTDALGDVVCSTCAGYGYLPNPSRPRRRLEAL
jgi:hypothetical protein